MARPTNNMMPKKNTTEERLRATPFEGVHDLDAEEKDIRLSVWRRFTESKVVEELLTKPEFKHVGDELKAGLSCSLNGQVASQKDYIYKISSEGKGMKLEVNRKFAESLGDHQIKFFQGVVQAGIEGYGALYMQIKGLLSKPHSETGDLKTPKSKK